MKFIFNLAGGFQILSFTGKTIPKLCNNLRIPWCTARPTLLFSIWP